MASPKCSSARSVWRGFLLAYISLASPAVVFAAAAFFQVFETIALLTVMLWPWAFLIGIAFVSPRRSKSPWGCGGGAVLGLLTTLMAMLALVESCSLP
jgi:hypothetical protein